MPTVYPTHKPVLGSWHGEHQRSRQRKTTTEKLFWIAHQQSSILLSTTCPSPTPRPRIRFDTSRRPRRLGFLWQSCEVDSGHGTVPGAYQDTPLTRLALAPPEVAIVPLRCRNRIWFIDQRTTINHHEARKAVGNHIRCFSSHYPQHTRCHAGLIAVFNRYGTLIRHGARPTV